MSIDFSVTTMSQMAGGATASAASSLATGSLMGNAAAQVEDPMSLLADAAEELTFAADTTDEYELEDRKERNALKAPMPSASSSIRISCMRRASRRTSIA